ncbi:MAG: hypothetical protein QF471_07845 [Phycisphaerales bacterium]|nr:hypothetical protein [Phycisphaerales bacterium]
MTQAERLQQALADADSSDLVEAYEAVCRTLARCDEWVTRGAITEAAALNADAGNVIGLIARLARRAHDPPPHIRLPDAETLERLVRLPADAAANRAPLLHWIDLNLREAPLNDRLSAIRSLRLLDPANMAWKHNHEELETAVVNLWKDEVRRCIASGDVDAISALNEQIEAMGFLGRSGQRLLHDLDAVRAAQRRAVAADKLDSLTAELHRSWAAMDIDRARLALVAWRRGAEEAGESRDREVQPFIEWIESEDRQAANDQAAQNRIDDLVRALDELEPLHSVERRYSSLRNDGIVVPTTVESRVAHRIAEERRRRTRSFIVALVAIVAVASVLVGVLVIRQNSIRRMNTIASLSACIEENLREHRLFAARDCWNEAVDAGLTEAPLIAAHKSAIGHAADTIRDLATSAVLNIEAATSLLEAQDPTLSEVDEALRLLDAAEPYATADATATLPTLRQQANLIRAARIATARDEREGEFAAIEAILSGDSPAYFDLKGWRTRADALRRAKHMLLVLRDRPAANQVDLYERGNRLERHIERMLSAATTRLERIQEADRLIDSLHRTPHSECMWHETWDDIVENHAALISEGSDVNWQEGRERSIAACASQRWRESVLPILSRAGILGDAGEATAIDAGRAKTSLQTHLDRYETHSPYRQVAKRLIERAAAAHRQLSGTDVRQAIEDAGLLDLYVADTEDGYRYLRRFKGEWRRVDTRADLPLNPQMLKGLNASDELDLYSDQHPAAISVALQKGLDAFERHQVPTTQSIADLLRFIQACKEEDQLLLLATYQTVWTILLDSNVPLPPQVRTEAEDWLQSITATASSTKRADWPAEAQRADRPLQVGLRREAGHAAATSPRVDTILTAGRQFDQETQAMAEHRVIQGLLLPDSAGPPGTMRVQVFESEVLNPEVLQRGPDGWQFFQLTDRLSHDQRINAPQGIRPQPVIIFGKP